MSVPGLVMISMRPKPRFSYSAENGFWFSRISLIVFFGGSCPPLKPSTIIEVRRHCLRTGRQGPSHIAEILGIVRERIEIAVFDDDGGCVLAGSTVTSGPRSALTVTSCLPPAGIS